MKTESLKLPARLKKGLGLLLVIITSINLSFGQAFDENTKILSLGLGGSDMYHIPAGYNAYYRNSYFAPITGEVTLQGEFAVYKYVGVGFSAGFGGRAAGGAAFVPGLGYVGTVYYSGYYAEFNMPIAVIANCHFYQIIADKISNGSKLHADKLDIYAGINLGSGFAIHPGYTDAVTGEKKTAIDALAYGGLQAGARYYFKPKMAAFAEVGWGKTWINGGITFKL
jgi:hypothetical protein